MDIDFIPVQVYQARRRRGALRVRTVGVGLVVLLMAGWIVLHQQDLATLENVKRNLDGQLEQIRIHQAQQDHMNDERTRLDDRRLLVEGLSEGISLVVILAEVSRRTPENIVLTELKVDGASIARYAEPTEIASPRPVRTRGKDRASDSPLGAAGDRAQLSLAGVAPSAPDVLRFVAALESSPLMDKVQLTPHGPATWLDRRIERFELTCELVARTGASR